MALFSLSCKPTFSNETHIVTVTKTTLEGDVLTKWYEVPTDCYVTIKRKNRQNHLVYHKKNTLPRLLDTNVVDVIEVRYFLKD